MKPISIKLNSNKYINVIFLFYIFMLIKFSFWGIGTLSRMNADYSNVLHNITPFKSITNYLLNFDHYNFSTWFYNTFGNVLLFLPLGILITLVFVDLKHFRHVIYLSLFVSLIIEIAQFFTTLGVLDVDDIILNTLGSILGFLILVLIKNKKLKYIGANSK
ncbi:VanZ family protein [Bacillus pseudomycoides]|uniref:VanZ family protein n=1 Tax=Bacillus pseudomycoides TaxID=64104 RepID=UPI000BF1763B|nr:VanZ family protein [Bacillus pseudomycoides]PEM26525.1 teicoplanin resistance protein VanZ [Bacillus pseudomycoides]